MTRQIWSGIDVAKNTFDASWVEPDSSLQDMSNIRRRQFGRDAAGLGQYLKWLDQQAQGRACQVRVVMEATGSYSLQLYADLVQQRSELQPAIINPKQAKYFHRSLGLRNKTDQVDSRSLGLYGRERHPAAHQPLTRRAQRLRCEVRHREALKRTLAAGKTRRQEPTASPVVRRYQEQQIRQLTQQIRQLEKSIRKLIQKCRRLRQDVSLLQTIPGVGWITAVVVVAELGDLRRFVRSRQVTAMVGLCPRRHQSGALEGTTHLSRQGNAHVRSALYLPAVTVSRLSHTRLGRDYQQWIQRGLQPKQALAAVMRKLLVLMRALLITNSPYQERLA